MGLEVFDFLDPGLVPERVVNRPVAGVNWGVISRLGGRKNRKGNSIGPTLGTILSARSDSRAVALTK